MDVVPRFLRVSEVAELLNISPRQTYNLLNSGELAGIRVGGRGQWRVERTALEEYIQRQYEDAKRYVQEHAGERAGEDRLSHDG